MDYKRLLERRHAKYYEPMSLLRAAVEYFEWAKDHPLEEETVHVHRGEVTRVVVDKVRPFTKVGLANYLGIPASRLYSFKNRQDESWQDVMELIEQVIYTQKFENAAAGLLNSNIISRDLGLADRREVTGRDGEAIRTINTEMTPQEAAEAYAATLHG